MHLEKLMFKLCILSLYRLIRVSKQYMIWSSTKGRNGLNQIQNILRDKYFSKKIGEIIAKKTGKI